MEITSNVDVFTYSHTMENLNIKADGNGTHVSEYKDHFIMVFDLTPTKDTPTCISLIWLENLCEFNYTLQQHWKQRSRLSFFG